MKSLSGLELRQYSQAVSLTRLAIAAAIIGFALLCFCSSALATFPGENGRILFTSNKTGKYQLYSMTSDGDDLKRLTEESDGANQHGQWSPDGSEIVFISDRGGNGDKVWMMNSDGSNQHPITDKIAGFQGFPSFSPDGN